MSDPENSTIYFMCPDVPRATGGIRVIYNMVDSLNELGYLAAVWHGEAGFRCNWFENSTPIIAAARIVLRQNDVLVVPEWRAAWTADLTSGARVVVLNQNHHLTFAGADLDDQWPGDYPGLPNAVAAIATSKAICPFVRKSVRDRLPVHLIPCFIDCEFFRPGEKEKIITFMPRRRHSDLVAVVQLLRRSPLLVDWQLLAIDGVPAEEVADLLGRSAIFLSMSDREGFGLPPAEAMAAGCYVIGFTGDGGREYMLPEFSSPTLDQDICGVVDAVERAVHLWEHNDADFGLATRAAREHIAANYNRAAFTESLAEAFATLTAPGSRALQDGTVMVRHFSDRKNSGKRRLLRAVRPWIPPRAFDGAKTIQRRAYRVVSRSSRSRDM